LGSNQGGSAPRQLAASGLFTLKSSWPLFSCRSRECLHAIAHPLLLTSTRSPERSIAERRPPQDVRATTAPPGPRAAAAARARLRRSSHIAGIRRAADAS